MQRFPETLLFCTATVIVLIFLNHGTSGANAKLGENLKRLAAVLALGIPLSLCIKIFFERAPFLKMPIKILVYVAAGAGLVLYYLFLLQDFSMVSVSRYVAISLALYLAFTFIPYFYRRPNYELYVIKLFISFLVTYLYAAILFGGLSAILATINYLFSANIPGTLYLDIGLVVAGIFAPAFFLAEIPAGDLNFEPQSYPKVLFVLLSYIVIPLIMAYCAILYAYFVKILVTRQWPEVMVSHLVLWYALISTLVIFCTYPLRQANRWIKTFIAYFPKLILPLLAMMFVAMGIRINAYGITENRYFVLAAGLWVTGSMLYLIISKEPRNVYLPASLALVAMLSVCGPWSSYSVSVLSQNRRFEKIAAAHNLVQDGQIITPDEDLPEDARRELSSIILYFDRYHALEELRALPEGFTTDRMEALLGFPLSPEYEFPGIKESYFSHTVNEAEAFWDISGFDYFMQFSPEREPASSYHEDNFEISYSPEDHQLQIISRDELVYRKNIAEMAIQLHRENAERDLLAKDEMTFLDRRGNLQVLYIFKHIDGMEDRSTGEVTIDYLDFYLFVSLEPE